MRNDIRITTKGDLLMNINESGEKDARLARRATVRTNRDRIAQVLVLEPWGLFSRLFSWF
ncbi:MAG TPA: hypothetical protein VN408_38575 [Actinoplanes sp.]|nr:hypothetical protein [Actinoplanes sp.]